MAPCFLTIRQAVEPEPSITNEKTIADFTHVVEQTRILERKPRGLKRARGKIDAMPALREQVRKALLSAQKRRNQNSWMGTAQSHGPHQKGNVKLPALGQH